MKIRVRFDAFDLREALFVAAVESMPPDASHTDEQTLIPGREDRFRELLAPWIDSSGQESGRDRIVVEFDLEAEPPTARVERRDGAGDEERQAVAELLVTIRASAATADEEVYFLRSTQDGVDFAERLRHLFAAHHRSDQHGAEGVRGRLRRHEGGRG